MLPLLASDAGVRLQVETGIASQRARLETAGAREWRGGFWLPECAHAPWLDPLLEEAGVHAVCVDLTDVLGRGSAAQLAPLQSADGPLLAPIDRETIELVWSDGGYPAHAAYRDYHAFTVHHHRVWSNAGRPTTTPPRSRRRAPTRPTSSRARSRGSTPAPPRSAVRRSPSARSTPSCSATGGTKG